MYVNRLYLASFRRFTESDLSFKPGLNLLEGCNGRGKTSVLEALYLLAAGSSFRTNTLKELVQESAPGFFIEAHFNKDDAQNAVAIGFDGEKRRVSISGHIQEKASALFGNILAIISTPDDLELIFGSPQVRRRELDILIAQHLPGFALLLTRYDRILQQRNKLLKMRQFDTISVWEEELAEVGSSIMQQRSLLMKEIQDYFYQESQWGVESWKIEYIPSVADCSQEKLLHSYQTRREQEAKAGYSLFGPHRDDILFTFEGVPAKSRVSLGQAKIAIFSFRLACWSLLRDRVGTEPLLLIDDLESFLDFDRRKALMQRIESMEQVIASLFSSSACTGSFHLQQF